MSSGLILTSTDLVECIRNQPLHSTILKLSRITRKRKTAKQIVGDCTSAWWTLVEHKGDGYAPNHTGRFVEVASLLWDIPAARFSFELETTRSRSTSLLDKEVARTYDKRDVFTSWLVQHGAWFGSETGFVDLSSSFPNTARLIKEAHNNAIRILGRYMMRDLILIVSTYFPTGLVDPLK